MAVAQAAGQPPEERAFREGQMAEIATLKQQMATLAAHKNQDFNPERIARIERDLQATRELEIGELRGQLAGLMAELQRVGAAGGLVGGALERLEASRVELEERVRGQFGFVHGELRDIRATLEGNEDQPSMESVASSEGERGGLDDPLPTDEGGRAPLRDPTVLQSDIGTCWAC